MAIGHSGMNRVTLLALSAVFSAVLLHPVQGRGASEADVAGGLQGLQQFIDLEADQLDHDREAKTITAVGGVHLQQAEEYKINANQTVFHTDSRRLDAVGEVELLYQQEGLRLRTDKATYDTVGRALEIPGKVEAESHGDKISGYNLHLLPTENRGTLEKMVLDMEGPGGHTTAGQATLHDANTMTLNQAVFTNCDCDNPPWQLEAESLYLDKEKNQLVGQNVALYLKGIPIAYTPWWQHPLFKKRQSGFLTPGVGHSGANGFELDLPYYWNIAPDKDATITLHPTTDRGLLVKGQFRYLGNDYRGVLENHSIYDAKDDEYRGLTLIDHKHNLDSWRLEANLQNLRTRDFLQDFHQEGLDDKTRYMTSNLLANRIWSRPGGISELRTGMTWFQNLETTSDQFTLQRLPYAHLEDIRPLNALGRHWYLETALGMDNFYQLSGDHVQRMDIAPSVGFRHPLYIGAVSGNLGLRETSYWSQGIVTNGLDQDDFSSRESSHVRLRLDGNLSRVYHGGENGSAVYRHSVEPTVQYVMNAANGQRDLPILDTALRDLTITNLFSQHIFSGPDRIVNGQWLAYGITSRLTGPRWGSNKTGEMAALTVGQRWAPSNDREFQNQHGVSDLVSNLDLFLSDHWSFSTGSLYDPHAGLFNRVDNTLTYNSDRGDLVAMGHYLDRRRNTEDAILVASIKLMDSWRWIQEGDYSLERATLNNWKSGLMYEHDCWSIQFLGGKRLIQDTSQHGGGWVGFLINFKGLGNYGLSS